MRGHLVSLKGDRGPQGERGPTGLAGPVAVGNDVAFADAIDNPSSLTFATLATRSTHIGGVLVMGDSVGTYGYPAAMKANLKRKGFTCDLTNNSFPGSTTGVLLSQLPTAMADSSPRYVTFQVSINDQRLDVITSIAQTVANVVSAIAKIRRAGAIPIIVGSAAISPSWINLPGAWGLEAAKGLVRTNEAVRFACAADDVIFVDMYAATFNRVGMLADGVHPSALGSQVWAEQIANAIAKVEFEAYPRTILFGDRFTRQNNAGTMGPEWFPKSGTWGILDGRAYCSTGADGDLATTETGKSNHALTVTTFHAAATPYGVIVRDDNSGNYLLTVNTIGGLELRVGGAIIGSSVAANNPMPITGTDVITVVAETTHFMVYLNGYQVISVESSTRPTGSRVGIYRWSSPNARFDSVFVTT